MSLAYLPAATLSLVLNFTSLVVAFLGGLWLAEQLGLAGWLGAMLSVLGGAVFFYPVTFSPGETLGAVVAIIGMMANAISAVLGRYTNHHQKIPALTVTVVSMGVGSLLLLAAGISWQGTPSPAMPCWVALLS